MSEETPKAGAFCWLPDHTHSLAQILPEALFASMLVIIGDLCFRLLEPEDGLQEIYGPLFVSVTILLWGYTFGCIVVGSARLGANGFFRAGLRHGPSEEASTGLSERQAEPSGEYPPDSLTGLNAG